MKKIKKYKYYILSFVLPLIICLIFLYAKNILFNVESFFVSDLRGQHLVFYNYLKNVLLGKNSIHYSYFAGMGSPMISALIFYVMSPLNILTIIIKDIRYAILSIYILKICLAVLTMFIYLKNKLNKQYLTTIIFSTCYALSSYAINYFFCIFWLDSLYLAPLVLLGIDKIIKEEKINLLYIFSLGLAIICNIQMGFSLCIFSVIYFIYSLNIKYNIKKDLKKLKKIIIIFFISSICAGAVSSGFLLAFISDYKVTNIARNIGQKKYTNTSSIDYIIKNIFAIGKIKTDYYNEYEPYIYCGLIVSILSILYMFDQNIDKKKRKSTAIVILIFIISFCIKSLNIFWHISQPILLNYRYSIYLGLFLTLIAYEYYMSKNKYSKKELKIIIISTIIGLIFDIIYQNEISIIHTIIFFILTSTLLILTKNISKKFELILFLTVITELTFNAYLSFYSNEDLPFNRVSSYDSLLKVGNLNDFDQKYRVSDDYTYAEFFNDEFLLNKNSSLRYFSSVINGFFEFEGT